jgi:hypothetical protein
MSQSLDTVARDLAKQIAAILKKNAIKNDEPADGYIMTQVGYYLAENEGFDFAMVAFGDPYNGAKTFKKEKARRGGQAS